MYAKIAGFGVVAAAMAVTSGPDLQRADPVAAETQWLLPPAVGTWPQTARWTLPEVEGAYQEYAQYAPNGVVVTVSLHRHQLAGHDAVGCFLSKGDPIEPTTVRSLQTLHGSARFNLARIGDGPSRWVVAAGQCEAQACIENPPPPGWGDLAHGSFWRNLLWAPPYRAIPVNISLAADTATPQTVSYATMEQTLIDFVQQLDLDPVRAQAALDGARQE